MSLAVPLDTSHSTCYHCQGVYDGTKIAVGQEITCPHCSQPLFHTIRFGDFLLKKRLGSGGTCTVYLAQELLSNREVAIKILKESLSKEPEVASYFLEEAKVTATLQHQNIVKVYGSGEYAGRYYLWMEHLSGGSFDDRIMKQGRLTELDCVKIGLQAAQALQYAAVKGWLHRDIKPGNILFDSSGTVKVVDFGLFTKRGGPNPNTGEIWGTAYYVPPERLNAQPEDFRSDMYALAASLYHGLTGRAPVDASDLAKLAERVGEKPNFTARISALLFAEKSRRQREPTVIPVRRLNPRISLRTGQTIDKAMAKNPKDRFQSYVEFVQCLDEAKRSLPAIPPQQKPANKPSRVTPPPAPTPTPTPTEAPPIIAFTEVEIPKVEYSSPQSFEDVVPPVEIVSETDASPAPPVQPSEEELPPPHHTENPES